MTLAYADAVDIGHNRGRLALAAARSLWRVDTALGHPADINEAWRSPEQANANYARYLRHLNGGPWAPIALPADKSVHCVGEAVDTDDTSDADMRVWNEHGWFWTVYRDGELKERWHLEYFPDRDQHRNDPAPTQQKDDDMAQNDIDQINAHTNTRTALAIRDRDRGSIFFADEWGADHVLDYRSEDIGFQEYLETLDKVYGVQEVSSREFDIAVAIAQRRWATKLDAIAKASGR